VRGAAVTPGEPDPGVIAALRAAGAIGRPLGSPAFLDRVAALTGRNPRPRKRGPKPRGQEGDRAAKTGLARASR